MVIMVLLQGLAHAQTQAENNASQRNYPGGGRGEQSQQ